MLSIKSLKLGSNFRLIDPIDILDSTQYKKTTKICILKENLDAIIYEFQQKVELMCNVTENSQRFFTANENPHFIFFWHKELKMKARNNKK